MDEVQRQASLSHVLETKLQHLMQILVEIEDFLDNLIYQKTQQAHRSLVNPLTRKHHIAKRVAKIKEKLRETIQRSEDYSLPNNNLQANRRRPLANCTLMKDEIIVGAGESVKTLVANFIGRGGRRGATYSAVVGMGGSGKTTLAKVFYNHKEITEAFSRRRAWVCVSKEWNVESLLLQICAMLGVRLLEHEKWIPDVKLQEFLEDNVCLVVLDDVWEREALEELLPILLSGKGRVLITTRKEGIVMFPRIRDFYLHTMPLLTQVQSWELFSKIVDNCCEGGFHFKEDPDFVKAMLTKCGGLPLAIVTLAGLLGTKSTMQQWENIRDRVIPIIMGDHDNDEGVKKVLELSYFDMPYDLKPCFLYLGTFEEDEEISVDTLINLWIGEGFVQTRQSRHAGTYFLKELVRRCMVQVTLRDYEGNPVQFQIHDLIRDLCINKANEVDFFQVVTPTTQVTPSNYRAIVLDRKSCLSGNNNPRLRTLIYRGDAFVLPSPRESLPFETLKHLRVLCLRSVELGNSAMHIGNMFLLRYLALEGCCYNLENVHFIKNLRNLDTLIISQRLRSTFIPKLPKCMADNMEGLRVLELIAEEGDLSPAISRVTNSKTLQKLTQGPVCERLVQELYSPHYTGISLRVLKLYKIGNSEHLGMICDCVRRNLPLLETLWLYLDKGSRVRFNLAEMKWESCLPLRSLLLCGSMISPEPWAYPPPRLLSLLLMETVLEREREINNIITRLDHLRALELYPKSYMGATLSMHRLPQLQKLTLDSLDSLKYWTITPGSMPKLCQLHIIQCLELEKIPTGIGKILTLKLLNVSLMPKTFWAKLEKKVDGASEGGEDFSIVQHIRTITFDHCDERNRIS